MPGVQDNHTPMTSAEARALADHIERLLWDVISGVKHLRGYMADDSRAPRVYAATIETALNVEFLYEHYFESQNLYAMSTSPQNLGALRKHETRARRAAQQAEAHRLVVERDFDTNGRVRVLTDERGVEYREDVLDVDTLPDGWALCLTCHRAWNDDKSTSVTPAPSARCPFEYEH